MSSCYQKLQSVLLYKAVQDISCGDSGSCGTHQQSQWNSNCYGKHIQRTVLCCENKIIFSAARDLTEAACTAFILYYIMNPEYPEGAAITLELVQRNNELMRRTKVRCNSRTQQPIPLIGRVSHDIMRTRGQDWMKSVL
ncbi:hypothetical protein V5799_005779 [Amblyomma americanum]|uniref:Uncharacterized protein n=1 Tax=Amblyomma americanum TaxID=6943 RepID=A0AAQ4DYA0_AMBAM